MGLGASAISGSTLDLVGGYMIVSFMVYRKHSKKIKNAHIFPCSRATPSNVSCGNICACVK